MSTIITLHTCIFFSSFNLCFRDEEGKNRLRKQSSQNYFQKLFMGDHFQFRILHSWYILSLRYEDFQLLRFRSGTCKKKSKLISGQTYQAKLLTTLFLIICKYFCNIFNQHKNLIEISVLSLLAILSLRAKSHKKFRERSSIIQFCFAKRQNWKYR